MHNLSFDLGNSKIPGFRRKIMQNVIVDRGSKYTIVFGFIESKEDVGIYIKEIFKDKYFQKSSHNSYAYRIKLENNFIYEGKNDDGEVGAGNCILRELQRENILNAIIIVTRYFGGIHLNADRFKNVIEASKVAINEIKNS